MYYYLCMCVMRMMRKKKDFWHGLRMRNIGEIFINHLKEKFLIDMKK